MTTLTDPVTKRPLTTRRCRKTRNKTVSHLEPIKLSSRPLSEIELAPGQEHMVCPDCMTWCPITGMCGKPKLVPHHTVRTGNFEPQRCKSSNRRIVLDVSLEAWRQGRMEGTAETASRRSTRVLRKPKVAVAAPVHRLQVPAPTVASMRDAYLGHRERCNGCTTAATCPDGRRLAAAYADLVSRGPQYSEQLAADERGRQEFEQRLADLAQQGRPLQWQHVLPAVEVADTQRKALPQGAGVVMPIKSATLPVGTPTTATKIDQERAENAERERQKKRQKKS